MLAEKLERVKHRLKILLRGLVVVRLREQRADGVINVMMFYRDNGGMNLVAIGVSEGSIGLRPLRSGDGWSLIGGGCVLQVLHVVCPT